jgi:hypothetical protein
MIGKKHAHWFLSPQISLHVYIRLQTMFCEANVLVCMSSTGPNPTTDMFAFGQTISAVAQACNPDVPTADLVAGLTKLDEHARLTAKQAFNHAFFEPVKHGSDAQTAECHLVLVDNCPNGCINKSLGVTCAGGHFVCSHCMESLMKNAFDPASDAPGAVRSRLSDGRIHCPHCQANNDLNTYSDFELVKALPASMCDVYLRGRMEFVKNRQRSELEAEISERMQLEFEKLQAMDELQRKVIEARKRIEQELQMKCPSCSAAFYDFDGCFAVNCATYVLVPFYFFAVDWFTELVQEFFVSEKNDKSL